MTEIVTKFDYSALNYRDRAFLEEKTREIRGAIHRTTREIADVGKLLIAIKERLGHGQFGEWLKAEFAWDERTARNLMNVARTFKSETVSDLELGAKTLYLLAADSTPTEVREEVIAEVKSGKKITHAEVKRRVDERRPPKRLPQEELPAPETPKVATPTPEPSCDSIPFQSEPKTPPPPPPDTLASGYQGDDGSKTGRLTIGRGLQKIERIMSEFIRRRPEKGDVATAKTLRQIIARLQQMLDDLERK